ncbi:MAG: hypothetical protein WA399_03910 [Acidobacteriaceae bacterium]
MKTSGITRTAILSLLLGSVALACAAQDRPSDSKDKDHPKQDNAHQQARPQAKPGEQHAQQSRPSTEQRQPAHHEQQAKQSSQRVEQPRKADDPRQASQRQVSQQQRSTVSKQQEHVRQQRSAAPAEQSRTHESQAQQHVQQAAWQQHRAGNWQSDHRTWQQRGGYHGYRIPDDRFRGYFGPDHGFRIQGLPFMVVGGYPRFQYDGYWLSVVDPWPADWGNDWYDNDQVYVGYVDNGYYLYNRSYPGVGIAVSISM